MTEQQQPEKPSRRTEQLGHFYCKVTFVTVKLSVYINDNNGTAVQPLHRHTDTELKQEDFVAANTS